MLKDSDEMTILQTLNWIDHIRRARNRISNQGSHKVIRVNDFYTVRDKRDWTELRSMYMNLLGIDFREKSADNSDRQREMVISVKNLNGLYLAKNN